MSGVIIGRYTPTHLSKKRGALFDKLLLYPHEARITDLAAKMKWIDRQAPHEIQGGNHGLVPMLVVLSYPPPLPLIK